VKRHVVLVTNGEQRSSLAVVRSLGRRGHRVVVGAQRARSLAGVSRFASAEFVLPSPLRDPAGFVRSVIELRLREDVDVIIPTTDDSLLALLPAREQLLPAVLPVGGEQAYRAASDKALLQSIAPRFGIEVPRQMVVSSAADAGAVDLRFPVVIKPSRSVSDDGSQILRHVGVRYAGDSIELADVLAKAAPESYPLLVQERVVGPGLGIFLLMWGGKQAAVFSHQRLREKPPSGGVSVYAESVRPDPDLVDRSRALLSHLGFEGVAMVEYKLSETSGLPFLMEVNGRFWGSLQLAIDAGVDFPHLLLSVAIDGLAPEAPVPLVGVRTRWWWGEVDHVLARIRRSPDELGLPPGAPTRWQAIRDFLRPGTAWDRNQILRLDDLRPAVQETLDWMRRR